MLNFSYNEKTKTGLIQLKVKASARENTILGVTNDNEMLKIAIKAPPEDGKANIAIIKMLADIWNLRQNQLQIIKGHKNNIKTLAIEDIEKEELDNVIKKVKLPRD